MKSPLLSLSTRLILPILIISVLAVSSFAGEFERTFNFDSKELIVANMIGAVEVVPAIGDEFKVTIMVQGDDASEDLIEFKTTEGAKGELGIIFPINDHRKYVYPAMGSRSKTTISFHNKGDEGGSWLKKVFGGFTGNRITVRGKGSGLEVWADVTIEVPRGRELVVKHGVGRIEAAGVIADLDLDINSGHIKSQDMEGDLVADTGSGQVTVRDIQGDVNIDTGSGSVKVENVEGHDVLVDTGSGSVTADNIICTSLRVDTGSGSVKARSVSTDEANIDTGSGSVLLQLDRMGTGKFIIDTGSGGITMALPDGASANIYADTGSGKVNNQIPGAMIRMQAKRELEMTVGDGEARVKLDAGSGSITIK